VPARQATGGIVLEAWPPAGSPYHVITHYEFFDGPANERGVSLSTLAHAVAFAQRISADEGIAKVEIVRGLPERYEILAIYIDGEEV
jgi:hypothetical protein